MIVFEDNNFGNLKYFNYWLTCQKWSDLGKELF